MTNTTARYMHNYNHIDYIYGEEWKVIPDFPRYLISSFGRIYSFCQHKLLKPDVEGGGYLEVILTANEGGKPTHKKIHLLVADVFIQNPEGCKIVHHKDGNKKNNTVGNLERVKDAKEHGAIHKSMRATAEDSEAERE